MFVMELNSFLISSFSVLHNRVLLMEIDQIQVYHDPNPYNVTQGGIYMYVGNDYPALGRTISLAVENLRFCAKLSRKEDKSA